MRLTPNGHSSGNSKRHRRGAPSTTPDDGASEDGFSGLFVAAMTAIGAGVGMGGVYYAARQRMREASEAADTYVRANPIALASDKTATAAELDALKQRIAHMHTKGLRAAAADFFGYRDAVEASPAFEYVRIIGAPAPAAPQPPLPVPAAAAAAAPAAAAGV